MRQLINQLQITGVSNSAFKKYKDAFFEGQGFTRKPLGVATASGSMEAEENAMGLVLSTSPWGPTMTAITGVAMAVSCTVEVAYAAVPCAQKCAEFAHVQ